MDANQNLHRQPQASNFSPQMPMVGRVSLPIDAKLRVPTKATRRIKGEIACAECRRLKVRCDRIIPCSTCVKRGCGALCPNGTIPPGEGSRFVLAATDHLRHKMLRMETRMRSLEDVIAIIYSSESDKPHPLLECREGIEEEEVSIFNGAEEEAPQSPVPLREALGTLWLDGQGGSLFFGPSGGSERLLMSSELGKILNQDSGPLLQELDPSYLPPEVNHCYQSFPFTPPNVIPSVMQPMIESFLPSFDRAIIICNTFLELSWMTHIVSRKKLINELIPIVYKQIPVPYGPHDLALLLVVLGIGSLVDLNLPPYSFEAQHYYRLSRATLALQPILGAQSVATIKVLHLMSIYNGMSGKERYLEQSYVLLDLAGQVALRIGFHIDPSMWGFEGREAYDRRAYFWSLMSGVLWQSLVTGRPSSLLTSCIDCRVPTVEDENAFQEGEIPIVDIWGFNASSECLVPLVRVTLSVKPPSYDTIMELDDKIRQLAPSRADIPHTATSIGRSHCQELMLLLLHRAYFAQAMRECPDNPLSSPYRQSVMGAYSSACIVLQRMRAQFSSKPELCARVCRTWSFTFSAAIVVGTLAIRGVHLHLEPAPLAEFEATCKFFASASEASSRAARALLVLQAMLQKAFDAHKYFQEQGKPAPTQDQWVDELLYVGGINQHEPTTPSGSQNRTTTNPPIDVPTHPQSRECSASSPLSAPTPHTIAPKYIFTPLPSLSMDPSLAVGAKGNSGVPLAYAGEPQPEAITPLTYPTMTPLASSAMTRYPIKALSDPTHYTSPPPRTPDMLSNQTFTGGRNNIYNRYPGSSYTAEPSTSGGMIAAQPRNLQAPPTWQIAPRRLPMPSSGSSPSRVAQKHSPAEIDPFIFDI